MARRNRLILTIFVSIRLFQIVEGQNTTCGANDFTCDNGECILKRWRCDNEKDCLDSSDEQNCESFLPCSKNQFQCKASKDCLLVEWRCDGDIDCPDGSDELNCPHISCTPDKYRCNNGICIEKTYVCDGDNDCGDKSDEASCDSHVHCNDSRFRCDSRQCITKRWRCDGDKDCDNGNDEKNCSGACLPDQWACQRGECIPKSHRCDGDTDCDDKSDEYGCPNCIFGQFRCGLGQQCIPVEWKCDGESDCRNSTDEKDCAGPFTCPNDELLCTSGECIKTQWLCDGEEDCKDGMDERNCSQKNSSCLRTQFQCMNGQCIDDKKVCDRQKDCHDGSDETQCPSWQNQTSCGANNGGCQHKCHNDGGSFRCSCEDGYQLDRRDSKSCTDLDECEIVGFCSQKCANSHGNFTCSCLQGYVLEPDRRKCKALGPQPSLIFSNKMDIRKIGTQTFDEIYIFVVDGLENAIAVDYFFEDELVFWTDTTLRSIKKAFMNGSNIQDVIKFGLESPCGLSVDWLGKKLYWVDTGSGRIEVADFDGNLRKAIFWQPLGKLRAIALYPSKGYLFWTEWDVRMNFTKSSISRANMDGTDVKRILHQDINWPNGLVVDYSMDRIFWIDAKLGVIESSDLDGNARRMVMRNKLLHPFAITVFEDSVYWTDTVSKAIFKANKFDGTDFTLLKRIESPMDIVMFHPQRQPPGYYGCRESGTCSHFCLASSSAFSCACPTGYRLINSTDCSDDIHEFLAYVGDFVVRRISLDTNDMLDVVLPFESVMDVFAMDWDPVKDEMYWADIDDDQITIRKGRMKPPHHETVIYEFPGKLSGIGVDWLSRKLYWSDEERNQIRVCHLDGSSATVVLWRKIVKPRNLILDVRDRYMYWTSRGKTVTINRAGMDGKHQTTLLSRGVSDITDLTLDKKSNSLFWTDGGNKLQYFSLLTRKRSFIKVSHHAETLASFSLAVHGNGLYWTDSNLRKVLYADRNTNGDAKIIGKYNSNPVRIAAFQRLENIERHPCNVNNAGCSHLCLLSPTQTFQCACPAGRHLGNDNKTCQSEILRFVLANSDSRLHHIPLSVSYKTDVLLPSEGNNGIFAFDVDVKHRAVYFIKREDGKKNICYVSLSGGNHTCILSNILYAPGNIAFDPVRHYIYWTDFLTKKIYLADGKGKLWTVIVWTNLDMPTSITVAYKHGYIFWVDLGKRTSISRANRDGSSRVEIVNSAMKGPNSLTVDHSSKQLYWTDYLQQRIELCDFNGNNRKIFAKGLAGPTSVALFSKFVYWTEWNLNVIKKAEKRRRGTHGVTVIKGMKRLVEIKAVNLRKIPVLTSACEQMNGGCSHFCLNNPKRITCACPVGVNLLNDGKTCETSPQTSILFSTGDTFNRISLDTSDFTAFPLAFKHVNNAIALGFDVIGERVYWTDAKGIHSAFTNGSDPKHVIKTNLSSMNALVVDRIGGNLLWTDSAQKTIEILKLNSTNRAILVFEDLEKPCGLAVYPPKGFLFWADCGNQTRIERSYMDGKSRNILISMNIHSPTGLSIDVDEEFLYWADSFYHTIERCNFNGERRIVVIKGVYSSGLALYASYIYWIDQRKDAVLRANKYNGSEQIIFQNRLTNPIGIIVILRRKSTGRNACFENNGNCSGLCLARPDGRLCASVCEDKLHFKESCPFEIITTEATVKVNTTDCAGESGEKCSTETTPLASTEGRTMTLAYIVGGIVLISFIIAMAILAFLCQRRVRRVLRKRNKVKENPMVPLRVSFQKSKAESMFYEGEIFANDPSVSILPRNSPSLDESPTVSCRPGCKRTLAVTYQPKPEPAELNDESQWLTISDV